MNRLIYSFLALLALVIFQVPAVLAQDVANSVTVDAAETTAYFTWPTDENAQSYQIDIYKDGGVFCHLTLGDKGQLLGISFSAPERKSNLDLAETFSFLVTGLDVATRYNFVLSALDANGTPLHVYIGDFATAGYNGLTRGGGDEVIPTPPIIPSNPEAGGVTTHSPIIHSEPQGTSCKRYENGQVRISKNGNTYNVTGERVE